MSDTECLRHRSGEQWVPSRTSTLSISVIDAAQAPAAPGARRVPFGFGIRDEPVPEPTAVAAWEGNPS